MLRKILIIAITAAICSCNGNIESVMLDADIQAVTNPVINGGDFTFRIFTNQEAFTVKSVSCEFDCDGVIEPDTQYTPKGGYCEFTVKSVSVSEDHNSEIEVTISDSKTGIVRTLVGHFICKRF